MNDYLQLLRLELKLILRNKLFLLAAPLLVISIEFPAVTLLLSQFLLLHHFTRDGRNRIDALLFPLPYSSLSLHFTRAIAALLSLLSLWPAMLLWVLFFPELTLSEWAFSRDALSFLSLKYFIVCLTQIGLTFFLCLLTRQPLLLYLFSLLLWLAASFLSSNLTFLPGVYQLFVLGHGFMLPLAPSACSGIFPAAETYGGFALFHAGLALLFTTLFIANQMQLRNEPLQRSAPLFALILLAVSALLFGSRFALSSLEQREHNACDLLQSSMLSPPAPLSPPNFSAQAYDLKVQLKTSDHSLRGTAIINGTITDSESGCLSFTLRDYFTVTSVVDLSANRPLTWRRIGSTLLVDFPPPASNQRTLSISISYQGVVQEWFPSRLAQPSGPVNFIAPAYSLLRSGYAWYPVPGSQELYSRQRFINPLTGVAEQTLQAKQAAHAPLAFTLTADTDNDQTIATNLEPTGTELLAGEYNLRHHFHAAAAHDVFLLSGPYERQTLATPDGKIAVYSLPAHKTHAARVSRSLHELYFYYATQLQENPTGAAGAELYTLIEIPPFFLHAEDGSPLKNLTLTDSILISENYFKTDRLAFDFLNKIQANKRDLAVLQRWWPEDLSEESSRLRQNQGNLSNSLFLYLYLTGLEKTHRAPSTLSTANSALLSDFCMPSLPIDATTLEVFAVLDVIRADLGEDAFKQLMRRLYRCRIQQSSVSAAFFSEAVKPLVATLPPARQPNAREHLRKIEELSAHSPFVFPTTTLTQFAFDLEEYLP